MGNGKGREGSIEEKLGEEQKRRNVDAVMHD